MPETRAQADTPAGFVSFCLRFPDQCEVGSNANQKIAIDDKSWRLLNTVNTSVNEAIWPEDDLHHYGRAEYWTIPTDGLGDCDDYAVTKRKELHDAGLPELALRIAVVDSAKSGRHAVLTVATDKGDFVLDNLNADIVAWNATDYRWIERQDGADPMKWVALGKPDTQMAAATAGLAASQ